ncbi:phosphatase PAP2 family protein [Nocardioides sp. MJB4]|uniref:Phosphatase PAP2 family protein n=2 Tax=Nocardioides donggukensis TaxID=2774019 RepID=A0A927K3J9_9ACTN|nr:phosphatase PAP2 family protein [Nocardioides donggukensis]
MATTMVTTHLLKWLVGRPRPQVQAEFAELSNGSFPSGHASYIAALGGVLVVVTVMLVRKAGVRRAVAVLLGLLAVVVCADRLLLGRHYPSDIAGGLLLGVGLVLLGMVVLSPLPRGHAETAAPLVESVPVASRDLHVVLNPIKVEDVGQFRSIVSAMAAESGWSEPVWHYTSVEDPGTGQAAAAAVAGADLVMVCGGDGTVREVCAELASTGIPVGIVPAGTGNLLARNLGIPLYLRSAVDVTLNGQDRAIDMVRVSGDGLADTHFMVMAGLGFDAAIMEGVNEGIKEKVGWLAYVLSALKSLMFPAVGIEVSVDDEPFTRHRARTVVVGNVGYLQAGMPLLPDATIDDGLLDVVLIHPKRFLSWLPIVWRVLAKRSRTDSTLDRMTGRKVVIRASTDTPRQLDGDSIGPGRELSMECIHGRLLVRVPR